MGCGTRSAWSFLPKMHTGVLSMTLGSAGSDAWMLLESTEYIWSHKGYWPWGEDLPLQCPQCGTPQEVALSVQ